MITAPNTGWTRFANRLNQLEAAINHDSTQYIVDRIDSLQRELRVLEDRLALLENQQLAKR